MKAKHKIILTSILVLALAACCVAFGACGADGVQKLTLGNTNSYFMVGAEFQGVDVQVTYNDGTMENLTLDESHVTGFDTSVAGKKTVVVTYENKTVDWEIEVSDLYIDSLTVKNGSRDTFVRGGEYNDGDIVIVVSYTDKTDEEVPVTQEMISLDLEKTGTVAARIAYKDLTLSHSVTVRDPYVSTAVVNEQTRTRYRYGDEFDKVILNVTYENGETEVAEITDVAALEGFDTTTLGKQAVTVTYNDYETTFDVEVLKKVVTIEVVDYTEMFLQGTEFDNKGELQIKYHDDTTETIALTAAMLKNFDTSRCGKHTATAVYEDLTADFDIAVPLVTTPGNYKMQAEDFAFCDYNQAESTNSEGKIFDEVSKTGNGDETVPNGAEGKSTANLSKIGNKIIIKFWSCVEGTYVFGTRAQSSSGSGKNSQVLSEVVAITVNGQSSTVRGTLNAASTKGNGWTNMVNWTELGNIAGAFELVKGENTIVIECLVGNGTPRFPNFDYFTLSDYGVTSIALGDNAQSDYFVNDVFEGVEIKVTHANGEIETVTLNDSKYVPDFDTSAVGEKTVLITYAGKEVEWTINVSAELNTITVKDGSKKTFVQFEEYSTGDIVLLVTYTDNSSVSVDVTAEMITLDLTKAGDTIATIVYLGRETKYEVTVKPFVNEAKTYKIQAEDFNFCDYSQAESTDTKTGAKFESTTTSAGGAACANGAEGESTANLSKVGNKIVIKFQSSVEGTFVLGVRAQSASGKGMNDQKLSDAISLTVNEESKTVQGTVKAGSASKTAWKDMTVWTEVVMTESIALVNGENTIVIECVKHEAAGVRFPNFDYFTLTVA